MTATAPSGAPEPFQSVFAGADVARQAGFTLPDAAQRPMFEQDRWDFTEVIGLPNQMAKVIRRLDFTAIINPAGSWSPRNRSWPCSRRDTMRSRHCPAPTAPRCTSRPSSPGSLS